MDLIGVKILVAVLFGVIRFAFGILPIQICSWLGIYIKDGKRTIRERKQQTLDYTIAKLQSFGGGVLFATCFLHMMPEVYYCVRDLQDLGVITTTYPISQLIVSIGFFSIYFLEELSYWVISIVPPEPCKRHPKTSPEETTPSIAVIPINQTKSDIQEELQENVKTVDESLQTEEETKSIDDIQSSLNTDLEELITKEVKTKQQFIRCVTIVIALSLHAIFEGLAIGLQHSENNIWYMFTAMSIHSATILFCIGLEIYLAGTKTRIIILHMFFLAITSPLGVFIGLAVGLTTDAVSKAKSVTVVILEGVSAGTILYITFFEVLNREKERRSCRIKRAIYIMAGFALMAALECLKVN